MLLSPRTSDTNGAGRHGDGGMDLRTAVATHLATGWEQTDRGPRPFVHLLPTPTARDWKDGAGVSARERKAAGHQPSLGGIVNDLMADHAARLLPTPQVQDERHSVANAENRADSGRQEQLAHAVSAFLPTPRATGTTPTDATMRQPDRWGEYGPAIRRWESLTRPAPEPTKLNAKGKPKLSDEFDEWLMGFPKGWITDVPGVTWNEALKACGNGVVWQQGSAALRWLLRAAEWTVA